MKLTTWNNSYKLATATLVLATTVVCNPAVAETWRESAANLTKSALMKLPTSAQKHLASSLQLCPSLQSGATELRLNVLKNDFLDTNNMRPFSYYVDEFLEIIDENPDYFKTLLFEYALREDTPDQDEVITRLRAALIKSKHMKNVMVIKSMLFKPVSKWVRKDTKIPVDKHAEEALNYHVGFNNG